MPDVDKWVDKWYRKSQSQSTKSLAVVFQKNWAKFPRSDEMLRLNGNRTKIFELMQSYIDWRQDLGNNPSTIRQYFMFLKDWFWYNGIRVYDEDVKHEITLPKVIQGEKTPLTKQIIAQLIKKGMKKKPLFLTLASSGMRIGETLNLRLRDFKMNETPVRVQVPPQITKAKRAKTTFISNEAAESLKNQVRKLLPNDLVFSNKYVPSVQREIHYFGKLLLRCGLKEKSWNNYNNTLSIHSFRSFFITKVARHDENFSKKWAGQKGYLLQYDRMPFEEQAEYYLKVEPDLTIF